MQTRGVERNVHTYTALMNVLIKCAKHGLALDTYRLMRQVRFHKDTCLSVVVLLNSGVICVGDLVVAAFSFLMRQVRVDGC